MNDYLLKPVAVVKSCFKEKFGIPRQPGLVSEAKGQIIVNPPFNRVEAFAGIETASHIWVQFIFHQSPVSDKPTVRPPRLGGNQRMGVFATRSPVRPNGLGLSVVKLDSVDTVNGVVLHVSGLDLVEGTPVVDIKPYVPYVDCVNDATNYFADAPPQVLAVGFTNTAEVQVEKLQSGCDVSLKKLVEQVLQQDPRPPYQPMALGRIYGMKLLNFDVLWSYRQQNDEWFIVVQAVRLLGESLSLS